MAKRMNASDSSLKKSCLLDYIFWEELGYKGGGQDVNRQQGEFGGEQL